MSDSHEWWMVGFDEPILGSRQSSTTVGDVADEFAQLMVYMTFQATTTVRRPALCALPGQPGLWLCVYSSYERLIKGHYGEDEIDYSELRGSAALALLPEHAGI